MRIRAVSVAGANTLLGQHLLARLVADPTVRITSLHDRLALEAASLDVSAQWQVDENVRQLLHEVPLLGPDAPARAPVLLSFLPELGAQSIEAAHLARRTRVITHCEYARLTVPLALPGITEIDP
jgi:hypothetical protein